MKSSIIAAIAILAPFTANAFTRDECNTFGSEVAALAKYHHDKISGKEDHRALSEVRDSFKSPVWMKSETFYYDIFGSITKHDAAFMRMSESDRDINRAFIAVQFQAKCNDGNL